jgi:hypothetical protein
LHFGVRVDDYLVVADIDACYLHLPALVDVHETTGGAAAHRARRTGRRAFFSRARRAARTARDFSTMVEDKLRAEMEGVDADVIPLGHTHIPTIRRVGNVHIVNPGSLGQPRHGLPSATYAVWEDGHLQIKHIDYVPSRRKTKSG